MSNYVPYTSEQLIRANETDLVGFLQNRGEKLTRVGSEYKWTYSDGGGTHDSITICASRWYDHKNQCGGRAIKFMQEQYGMDFPTADEELLGSSSSLPEMSAAPIPPKKEFELPDANDNMRRVFAYLTKQRFIDATVLSHFAHEKLLYEDSKYHNAVFVGVDENGVPRQASKRSTTNFGKAFKQTVDGSDTRYSFAHFGISNRLFVFEAPIDMLSFITLNKTDWKLHSYVAMNGVYENAMLKALENHANLDEIVLCVDNDEGGIEAVDRLRDILSEKGYKNVKRIAPSRKDWNEVLKQMNGVPSLPAVPHRRKDMYLENVDEMKPQRLDLTRLNRDLLQTDANDYDAVARLALTASATFLKRSEKLENPDSEIFELLKNNLKNNYKPYTDRVKAAVKKDNMVKQMRSVLDDLRFSGAQTREQMKATAGKLFLLADCALRCRTEEILTEEQTMKNEQAPSESEALDLSFG